VIEGEKAAAPAAAGEPVGAPSGSGLRFAEDLAPVLNQPAKKAKKTGKKDRGEEEGAKAKSPKRSKRFAVVEEDEDFGTLLEEYGDTSWEDEQS
ncbi:MAG TPA: hypothetical protein VMT90_08725, partial [Dehalococcoidia bacterium]|nr:hypothetical protein [Dehalococcoidia bacterium]